jgi:hypothetical protein
VRDRASALLASHDAAGVPVRVVGAVPVDARHQSKIDRAALARALAKGRS